MVRYLKRERTYKFGRAVLSGTSIYFGINKLTLQISNSFHVPYIVHSDLHFRTVLFMFPFLLIDHNRKQVLLIKRFMLIFVKSQLSVR